MVSGLSFDSGMTMMMMMMMMMILVKLDRDHSKSIPRQLT